MESCRYLRPVWPTFPIVKTPGVVKSCTLAPSKDTPRVHRIASLRPLAAEIGLGRPPVGPVPPVESAVDPVLHQEGAGRDHLGAQRLGGLPVHLAEIGGLAASDQGLEAALPGGAHDLDLEVPAAGCPPPVVGGAARGADAGVGSGVDRELPRGPGRRRQCAGGRPPPLANPETAPPPREGAGNSRERGSGRVPVPPGRGSGREPGAPLPRAGRRLAATCGRTRSARCGPAARSPRGPPRRDRRSGPRTGGRPGDWYNALPSRGTAA